jgi:hypothetical protein
MPDANRCDLLSTIRNTDLPIEIKGQWHSNVWDAACDQLEDNYARNYRSEGRGIYLVLWFGHVPRFNPPGAREYGKPKDASEMLAAIYARSPKTSGACPGGIGAPPGPNRRSRQELADRA